MAPAKTTDRTIYIARESFSVQIGADTYNVTAGTTRVRAGHILLAGDRAKLFEPITADYEIEDASAAPGQKRGA